MITISRKAFSCDIPYYMVYKQGKNRNKQKVAQEKKHLKMYRKNDDETSKKYSTCSFPREVVCFVIKKFGLMK